MTILRYYTSPAFSDHKSNEILEKLKNIHQNVETIETELCYHVELKSGCESLNNEQIDALKWLLTPPLHPGNFTFQSILNQSQNNRCLIECGPRYLKYKQLFIKVSGLFNL